MSTKYKASQKAGKRAVIAPAGLIIYKTMRGLIIAVLLCFLTAAPASSEEEEIVVAAASNFLSPLKEIARQFQVLAQRKVNIVSGSTGSLFAQIVNGAPFHIFLSADDRRPQILEEKGLAVQGTRYVYALGRLALWSADPDRIGENGVAVLRQGGFRHLAIANPKTAPYGQASVSVLKKLELWTRLLPLIIRGANISQAFQFTATGNAELGFVALSQALDPKLKIKGSWWVAPRIMHGPLAQSAVLLQKGKGHAGAKAFMKFMRGTEARQIITKYGYGLNGD